MRKHENPWGANKIHSPLTPPCNTNTSNYLTKHNPTYLTFPSHNFLPVSLFLLLHLLLTILTQSSILSPFLSPSFLSIVQDKVVSKTERQNGTIVSIDPPFHSRHLLTMHPAPSLASLAWASTETSRKLQNHIGPASHHRKSSLRKANVSVESTGSYRKKPASTSFPAMTSLTTTMFWTTSSFSE